MSSAAGVRAGGAFIEIFAKDGQFQQAMLRVQGKLKAVGRMMQQMGTMLSLAGTAIGVPMVLAARQAATFEDALLGMKAAAGLTDKQVQQLADEALRLSKAMGIDPAKIANAFLELTKAGMSVEDVLAGAGRSAVEFARVSGVEMKDAAEFMKVAMNTFGISAKDAVDTLSAAADASETSIAAMVESFSQVGSAGKTFDQTLFGVAQAMAALAKYGISGEEAGTAIKTLLTKLVAPTGEAHEALATLGLSVRDFRDEAGKLLPIAQIAGVFEKALSKMGGNAEDVMMAQAALVDVFEQRGIKVIGAFADLGEKGFEDIAAAMEGNLPVAAKFEIMMSGITGGFERLFAATKRLSIAFAGALGSSVSSVVSGIVKVMDFISQLIAKFPILSKVAAGAAAVLIGLGAALIVVGLGLRVVGVAIAAITSPIGIVVAAVGGLLAVAYKLSPAFKEAVDSIMAAFAKLDIGLAFQQINVTIAIALTRMAKLFHVTFAGVMARASEMVDFIVDQVNRAANQLNRLVGGNGNEFPVLGRDGRQKRADDRRKAIEDLGKKYDDTVRELRAELADAKRKANRQPDPAPAAEGNDARRDRFRKPLGGPGAMTKADPIASLGTFASSMLGQLGIGPKIDIRERAAKAQEKAADAMKGLNDRIGGFLDEMKKRVGDRQPSGATIDTTKGDVNKTPEMQADPSKLPWWAPQSEFEKLNKGPGGGMRLEDAIEQLKVSPRAGYGNEPPKPPLDKTSKDMVSASEQTAAAMQRAVDYLSKIYEQTKRGGVAFA
jgi:TP901 family phage tail tape measure protein